MAKSDKSKAPVTGVKTLKDLLGLARRTKEKTSELAGELGSAIRTAVENKHLHRKAFRSVIAEDRMEPDALADFYDAQDYYRDVLGLVERAKSAPRLPIAEKDEDEEADEGRSSKVTPIRAPSSVAAE